MKRNVYRRLVIVFLAALFTILILLASREYFSKSYRQLAGIIPGVLLIASIFLLRKIPKEANFVPLLFFPMIFPVLSRFIFLIYHSGENILVIVLGIAAIGTLVSLILAAAYQQFLDLWHPGIGLSALLGGSSILLAGAACWFFEIAFDISVGEVLLIIISGFWVFGTGISFCLESRDDILRNSYFDKLINTFGRNEKIGF